MVRVMSIVVRPATADGWSDLIAVFGRRGEDPSWCWCQLFLRRATAKHRRNKRHQTWVTCFAVDRHYRRSGVGLALLQAAVEFAREHGATVVEGHPVDVVALKAARVAPSALYTGTKAMFAAAGFAEVARTYPSRPVMRLAI